MQSLADTFALPQLSTTGRQQILDDRRCSKIGMPYIWGGTSDGPETEFGVPSRGGYDCSGFVWRVYKLQSYPGEGDLASVLQGRTTYQMSVEVPALEADRVREARSPPTSSSSATTARARSRPQVGHMGIYVGNGWFIHSSGVRASRSRSSTGWYAQEFAWAPPAARARPGSSLAADRRVRAISADALSPLRVIPRCASTRRITTVWRPRVSGGKRMLEWKPRLIVLVLGIAVIAASLSGFFVMFDPSNFGWGAW